MLWVTVLTGSLGTDSGNLNIFQIPHEALMVKINAQFQKYDLGACFHLGSVFIMIPLAAQRKREFRENVY